MCTKFGIFSLDDLGPSPFKSASFPAFFLVCMPMLFLRIVFLCTAFACAAEPLLGVVLEEGTDRPVPYAEIQYISGKSMGQADRRGHFELMVERHNVSLMVVRSGYDTLRVELQDYADLMDVVFSLRSSVRELGQTTVRASVAPQWRSEREVPVAHLEDAAGLRFDLAEHLSQLPGMSGQRDFSSQLSYDGSRPEEVEYNLSGVRMPNMRHLDVGFPGNLSVLNPHVLANVGVFDHYDDGPAELGLASAVLFTPDPGNPDDFKFRFSAGTTVREFSSTGPWLFWDAYTVSFRWLDPSMLKNMGEKFFTEYKKRDASCSEGSDCDIASSDNAIDLGSWDLYSRFSGSDSSGAKWGLTTLMSRDNYEIDQDTSSTLDSLNSVILIKGDQAYSAVIADYEGAGGLGWHAGWVLETVADTLRDTATFRSESSSGGDDAFRNYIDGGERSDMRYVFGLDDLLRQRPFGADASWAAEYERHQAEQSWYDYGGEQKLTLGGNYLEALGRLTWKTKTSRTAVGVGAASTITGAHRPLASLDWEHQLGWVDGLRIFGGSAWRSQYVIDNDGEDLDGLLVSGASAKLGLGLKAHGLDASVHGFGRYYLDPRLPEPKAFWHYQELAQGDYAWVSGASATLEARTLHHVSLQSNASSVYGEYQMSDGSSLAWPANVRLEIGTHLRIYPRNDSLISIILSHRVAWHRPLYAYTIQLADDGVTGTRKVHSYAAYTSLYRTDARVNLDLASAWKPLENVRFYVEVDNLFEPLNVNALQWLGSGNARERSQVIQDADHVSSNGVELVPFLAKGMGLYVQFGVEGNLGI